MNTLEFNEQANFIVMVYGYGSQEYKEFMEDKLQPIRFNEDVELTEEEAIKTVKENIRVLKNAGCYHSNYTAFHLEGQGWWNEERIALWNEVKALANQFPAIDYEIEDYYHWSAWQLKEMDWYGESYTAIPDHHV